MLSKYRDLKKIFDPAKIKLLLTYRFYNHKIELIDDISYLFKNRVYFILNIKHQKLKEYLNKNLQKDFINFSYILYVSSILFVVKFNKYFRVYIDYRRLNAIIRRNRYLISLIEKILAKVIECKYLTKLKLLQYLINCAYISIIKSILSLLFL